MSERFQERNKAYLQSGDSELLQLKRAEHNVELRKSKRYEHARKKRLGLNDEPEPIYDEFYNPNFNAKAITDQNKPLEDIYSTLIAEYPENLKFEALQLARKNLSASKNPDISRHSQLGLFPVYMSYVNPNLPLPVQAEATWILVNLTNGEHRFIESLLKLGIVEACLSLVTYEHLEISENVFLTIGNIAGDFLGSREDLVAKGCLDVIINFLEATLITNPNHSIVKNLVWALSMLALSSKKYSIEQVERIISATRKVIGSQVVEIRLNCLWILFYITSGTAEMLQAVINYGLPQIVANLYLSNQTKEKYLVIKIIGNILGGDVLQAQAAIDANAIQLIKYAIQDDHQPVRKEGYWALSNLAAGTKEQIGYIFSYNLHELALNGLNDRDSSVRLDAVVTFFNLCVQFTYQEASILVGLGLVEKFKDIIRNDIDPRLLEYVVRACHGLLRAYNRDSLSCNGMVTIFDSTGLLDQLMKLEMHQNKNLSSAVKEILTRFFGVRNEDENHKIVEPTAHFEFS
ncbi:unnamed protein product [Blepharisma stoltei]|uniref:Importin subunit alpha n=1 Tax=Blepharisma stoltei TaxID=1481888 RepID=A0AAU9KLR6_9CILI|nr:unnamed protein product [Blepharisma stoltei]